MDDGKIQNEGSSFEQEWMQRLEEQRRKRRAGQLKEEKIKLVITSLMDIMTIMLVFLLISITSDPLNVKQDAFLQLARSTANISPKIDSIPILVTKQHIIVDNKPVVELKCRKEGQGECTQADFEELNECFTPTTGSSCKKQLRFFVAKQDKHKSDPNSMIIEPLKKSLQAAVDKLHQENKMLGREFKGVVTLIVDKTIPYRILAEVLYTSGKVGFQEGGTRKGLAQFRCAIIKSGVR